MKRITIACLLIICAFFHFSGLSAAIETHFRPATNKAGLHWMAQIDFVYLINSDHNPEKYEHVMQALQPYGIFPYRFSAINAEDLSIEALNELGVNYLRSSPPGPLATVFRHIDDQEYLSHEIMQEANVAYYSHGFSRASIANLLSHLSILQDAYDSGYQVIWVMEDNIKVNSSPNEISRFISALNVLAPDWDILFTDNEMKGKDGHPVHCLTLRPRPMLTLRSPDHYLTRTFLNAELIKIGMRFGSHSMVIKRSGIKKILDFFKMYKVYFPYDIDCFYIPGITLFMCNRDIVTNKNS